MSLSSSGSEITGRNRVCKHCKFTTTDAKEFYNHQTTVHGEQQVCCENCGQSFDSDTALDKHLGEHCGQTFKTPDTADPKRAHSGIAGNVMTSEVATMQLSPGQKGLGEDVVNNNEIHRKTAFLENNPDYPGSRDVSNDGASTSPISETVSNSTANDSGFAKGSEGRDSLPDLEEEQEGHKRNQDVSDDIELVIDEDAHQEATPNVTENPPNYINITPENDSSVGNGFSFSPASTYSLINPKIFAQEALKSSGMFSGHVIEKNTTIKDHTVSANSVTPPRRCAPVREAVDPAKYITVQEGDGVKFACSKCGNIYKWRKSLNKHWKEKHDGEIPEPRTGAALPVPRLNAFPRVATQQKSLISPRQQQTSPARQDLQYPPSLSISHPSYRPNIMGGKIENPFDPMRPGILKTTPSPRSRTSGSAVYNLGQSNILKRAYPSNSIIENLKKQQQLLTSFLPNPCKTPSSLSPPPAHSAKRSPTNIPRPALGIAMDLTQELPDGEGEVLDLSMKSKNKSPPATQATQDEPLDFSVKQENTETPKPNNMYSSWVTARPESSFMPYKSMAVSPVKETTAKPKQCKMCTYVTRDDQDMENHMQLHVAQDVVCAECQESFQAVDDLNQHFVLRHMQVLAKRMAQIRSEKAATVEEGKGGDQLYMYLTQGSNKRISTCVVCGAMYQFQWALARHFDQEHSSLPNPYQLPDSPESGDNSGLREMEHAQTAEADKMYKCSQCPFTATTTSELTRHQIRHSLNKHHVCKVCGYTAKAKEELVEHYEVEHPGVPADLKSSTGTVMLAPGDDSDDSQSESTHIIGPDGKSIIDLGGEENTAIVFPQAPEETTRNRPGRKPNTASSVDVLLPYKCSVCEYRARWPSEITQHMKNHSDEKPFRCPRCTYKSKWKWDVVKHLKRCGGGTVKDVIDTTKLGHFNNLHCHSPENLAPSQTRELSKGPPNVTVIPNMEKSPYGLDYTRESGMDETLDMSVAGGQSTLECRECPFVATSMNDMRKHSKFHTYDVQQVYCSQCPFVGNNPAELKRHLRVHSDEKPFVCKTCGYSSKWKCDLKKHCRTYNHQPAVPLTYGGHGRKPQVKDGDGSEHTLSDDPNASEYDSADTECNGYTSANHSEYSEHVAQNEYDESNEFRCDKCPYVTSKKAMLETHMKIHGQNINSPYKCKQCDYQVDDFSTFMQHKFTHSGTANENLEEENMMVDSEGKPEQSEPSSNRRKQSKQSIMKNKSDIAHELVSPDEDVLSHMANGSLYENCNSDGPADYSMQSCNSSPADYSVGHKPFAESYERSRDRPVFENAPKFTHSPSYSSPTASPALSPVTGKPMYSEGKKTKRRLKSCGRCGYITDNVTTLQRHMAKHGKQGKYTCAYCDYSVDKQHVVDYHMRIVHNSKTDSPSHSPLPVPSPIEADNTSNSTVDFNDASSLDNMSFGEPESLDFENADAINLRGEDVKIVHIGNRTVYGCVKCTYNSMKVSSILKHSRQHGANKRYSCTKCDYSVDHISHVRNHMKTVHGDSGPGSRSETPDVEAQMNGDVAGNEIENSEPQVKRMRWDSNTETPFSCSNCSFEGENMTELVAHRCPQAQEIKCEQCEYACVSSSLMKLHAKTHTVKSSVKMHFCDKCPYRTASRSQLENHRTRHGVRNKHSCPYCDYSCGNTTQQGNHVKLHFPNQNIERDVLHLLMKGENVTGFTPKITVSESDLANVCQGQAELELDEEQYDEADDIADKSDYDFNANTPVNGQFKIK